MTSLHLPSRPTAIDVIVAFVFATFVAFILMLAGPAMAAPLPAGPTAAQVPPALAPPPPAAANKSLPAPAAAALRRYALIASANDGGGGRAHLRYADSDARTVADVLQTLGGLASSDLLLVPSATPASLQAAFDRLKQNMSAAGPGHVRRELFVYYSGHSDEEGLLLAGQRVSYRQLRTWIDGAGADVRIAVLDSCASGALIRLKGGMVRPPFLTDLSTDARGHAFLTASSADEAAQESERIGAAFFTHYLVSGLRGAADTNRNGRVTLNEAYQFAYQETLRRTERTAAGPQHPAYDIQLAGTGDLVMTDLSATGAALVLDENVAGRIYVRDRTGRLLVELRKEPSYPVELGLGPGEYRVSLDDDGRPLEANVVLVDGKRARLGRAAFSPVAVTVAVARGNAPAGALGAPGADATVAASAGIAPGAYRVVPFDLVVAPGIRTSGNDGRPVLNNFVLGIVGHSDALKGMQLSLGGNMVEQYMHGWQAAMGFNLVRGSGLGLQTATGANIVQGSYEGVQFAQGTNITMGNMKGLQGSLVNWLGGDMRGAQLGVINRSAGDMRGLQVGVIGVNNRDLQGAQLGVIGMAGGNLHGLQAGVVNLARGLTGLEVGVANLAGSTKGAQLGVVNVGSQSVDGLQIAVVNVGRKVRGLQLGVINLADSVDGASVGIINLIGDGYHQVSVWSSDLLPSNVGIKLGSRHVYTMFGFGVGKGSDSRALYGPQFGLGVHLDNFAERLFVDIDAVGTQFAQSGDWEFNNQAMSSLRVTVGFQLFKHLAITAGPTYNVYVRRNTPGSADHTPGLGVLEQSNFSGDYEVRRFPGFMLGLQI
jgi:hypothetical protein